VDALAATIASEVPMAVFIGMPDSSTSAGTIRKPPPTPTTPVSAPKRTGFPLVIVAGAEHTTLRL
jgi:hypothetical protein